MEHRVENWRSLLEHVDADVGIEEARELGRGLLRLLAERRARTAEGSSDLLRHAIDVLEMALWYLEDAYEYVEECPTVADLVDLRGCA